MNLVLIGGGGYAIELFSFIKDDLSNDCKLVGFYDDNKDCVLSKFNHNLNYLGRIDDFHESDHACIIAIANPIIRAKIYKKISINCKFYTYIHSSAIISSSARIGESVVIGPNCIVSANAEISNNVCLNVFCGVGHGSTIQESSVLGPYALVNGDCSVGIACYLGSKSVIFPGINIGNGVSIDAGSIVRSNITDFILYAQKLETLTLPNRLVKKDYNLVYD